MDDAFHDISGEGARHIAVYISVHIYHEGGRIGGNAVHRGNKSGVVHDGREGIALVFQEFCDIFRRAFPAEVGGGYAEDNELIFIFTVFFIELLYFRHFGTARAAPGRPEVQKYGFSFVVGERVLVPVLVDESEIGCGNSIGVGLGGFAAVCFGCFGRGFSVVGLRRLCRAASSVRSVCVRGRFAGAAGSVAVLRGCVICGRCFLRGYRARFPRLERYPVILFMKPVSVMKPMRMSKTALILTV